VSTELVAIQVVTDILRKKKERLLPLHHQMVTWQIAASTTPPAFEHVSEA
jgi:hypothetical protein